MATCVYKGLSLGLSNGVTIRQKGRPALLPPFPEKVGQVLVSDPPQSEETIAWIFLLMFANAQACKVYQLSMMVYFCTRKKIPVLELTF